MFYYIITTSNQTYNFFKKKEFQLMVSIPNDSTFIIIPKHQSVFGVAEIVLKSLI